MKVNDDFITKKTEELLKEGESRKLLMGEYSAQEMKQGKQKVSLLPMVKPTYPLPAPWKTLRYPPMMFSPVV